MEILRLALRNLWRNTRRTLLTVFGIALALGLMLTSMSLENGVWNRLIASAIQAQAGHVVLQAQGWQEDRDAAQVLHDSQALADELAAAYPEGQVVRRVFLGGLITSPTGSSAITLQGIEPEAEAPLTLLDERLVDGEWLDDDRGILIGDELAATLDVGLGDKVVLMTQVGDGDMDSRLFRVRGLFHTGSEMLDNFAGVATLTAGQELLPGEDTAHQIALVDVSMGSGKADLEPARRLVDARSGTDAAGTPLQLLGWTDALPLLEEQRRIDGSFSKMLYFFMALIVAVGVLNTVLMSVMERMREFGVMLAVGMSPRRLATMIVLEGFGVGLLGGLFGVGVASAAIAPLSKWGIDYGELLSDNVPVSGVPIDTVVRAEADPSQLGLVVVMAVVMAVIAAMWPARKVLSLEPVDAIHHV